MKRVFALILCLALALPLLPAFAETKSDWADFEVHILNVGRNDGILIICEGEAAFIDSGSYPQGEKCRDYMLKYGVTELKYYIASHAHLDHVGGAGPIVAALPTETMLIGYSLALKPMLDRAEKKAEKEAINAIPTVEVRKGDEFPLGGAVIKCIAPDKIKKVTNYRDSDENQNSLVMKVTYKNVSAIFCADAPNDVLLKLLKEEPGALDCDIFKSPHHNQGMTTQVYEQMKCGHFVFSTSEKYTPTETQINRARRTGARVFITSSRNSGAVRFKSDGETITTQTQYSMKKTWKLGLEKVTMKVGGTKTYSQDMRTSSITNTLYFTSSDPSIAYPDPDTGKIHAVAPGQCVIRAIAFDNTYRDIKVTVKPKQ